MSNEPLSGLVREVLVQAGWSPDRRVDASAWTGPLGEEGFVFSQASVRFLESFGGLEFTPPRRAEVNVFFPGAVSLDPLRAAAGELDRFDDWQDRAGTPLAPIGGWEIGAPGILMMDAAGRMYAGLMDDLDRIGDSTAAGLELLIGAERRGESL